ncbi:hypothetical protein XELAEV_18010469mg [Xenopus laevis]|uniref:Uncharacterized protein n=1 Tax=Xenopus laevis TaxID=8355 RepID=A0A974I1S0_XENLA|nr:hypothetical protein XELAEV_18010469mg [Xenopus laevis]
MERVLLQKESFYSIDCTLEWVWGAWSKWIIERRSLNLLAFMFSITTPFLARSWQMHSRESHFLHMVLM